MLSAIALIHGIDRARRLAESAAPDARTVYESRRRRGR
jgi:hypothetical protein